MNVGTPCSVPSCDRRVTQLAEVTTDLMISVDIIDDIINEADSHNVDQAIVLRKTLMDVIEKAREGIVALDVHLLSVLEAPIQYQGWAFERRRKSESKRYNHKLVAAQVPGVAVQRTADPDTGEMAPEERIHREIVDVMLSLYTSGEPDSSSTSVKVTQLDRYGISRDGIVSKVPGERYINAFPLMAGDQSAREA